VRRLARVTAWTAGILAVLLVAVTVVVVWAVRRPFPDYAQDVELPGLGAEVEVVRDASGVPTVWADTAADLFRVQGYLHAQDRFWEMDVRRHITAGRLSELFGESQVETDTFLRTMGWRRVAEAEVALLSPTSRGYYEAYAAGVNAYLTERSGGSLALPYAVLGLQGVPGRPEPWTVVDSLAWFKALAWDLRANLDQEIERSILAATLPPERVAQLFPPFPYDRQQPILSEDDVAASRRAAAAAESRSRGVRASAAAAQPAVPAADAGPALPAGARAALLAVADLVDTVPAPVGTGAGIGSNSWVVSPERTASGRALLANDPHLAPSLPSVWTQVGLRCREVSRACPFDVRGFSMSGVPGVLIGHTEHVAWGLSTTYADTMDLYLEMVEGDAYLTEDGRQPLEQRTETIRVAGEDDVVITVRSTRHGPLLSDASEQLRRAGESAPVAGDDPRRGQAYAVALRWAALLPGRTGDAVFAMNQARTWDEFRAATELFESPVQNVVFADADGNIGYQVNGRIPRRTGYDGHDPVPGWTGDYDWSGFLTIDQRPHVLNPDAGYLATANEATVPEDYPWVVTTDPGPAYRGDRIRSLLAEDDQVDNATSNRIAMDTYNGLAEILAPRLLAMPGLSGYYADGQRLLVGWDYTQPPESGAAAYFSSVWSNLLRLTFHDDLPEEFWPNGGARWWEVVRAMLDEPADPFWDDAATEDVVETRDAILLAAMRDARDECTRLLGKDPSTWQWGRMHRLQLREGTLGDSGIAPIEALFNRGPFPVGGGSSIVQANAWSAATGYGVDGVPSMRMQVDFGDLDASRWVQLTGQSGHPFHEHYTDQTELWRTGGTLPMRWTDESLRAAGVVTATFRPQPAEPSAAPPP
jgi:penicillin amidase